MEVHARKNHLKQMNWSNNSILKSNLSLISYVSGTWHPEDYRFTSQEMEYLDKLDWAWHQLLPLQRSKIVKSVTDGTLRQGSSKHCFIAEAIRANRKVSVCNDSLLDKISMIVRAVFYQDPSFDFLFYRDISSEEREKLNDIYYAKIGDREHQYQRATELARTYVTSLLITPQQ